MGSITYNVAVALAMSPMTFDALKNRLVDDFLCTEYPGLRRRLANVVYDLKRQGIVSRRGEHGPEGYAKFRRWETTPFGREAIVASEARFRCISEDDAATHIAEDAALSSVVDGRLD